MAVVEKFLPRDDRFVALLLYGMVFCTCFNGYDAGVMTVILAHKQFNEYYGMDYCQQVWAASYYSLGYDCIVEVIPNSFGVLILSRLLTDLGFSCVYIATNLYVAECASAKLQGSFVGIVSQFSYQLGTLIAFWTGYGMSFDKSPYNIAWRVSNIVQIPIGLASIFVSFWYPESPRLMLEKYPETPKRSLHVLSRPRSGAPTDERIRAEFHELVASHGFRRQYDTGYKGLFKDPSMRKHLAYGFYAAGLQQCGDIASLTMYATLIYQSLGWDSGSQALAINGIQRRSLLLVSFTIQSLTLLIISCLCTAFPSNSNKAAAVVEVAMLFIVGFDVLLVKWPVAAAVVSEISPQHVRDKGFGLSILGQTSWLILLTQSWPSFNAKVKDHSCWLLFALNVTAGVSAYFILPETKGISLEQVDKIFGVC